MRATPMSNEQWTFTEPEVAKRFRQEKERARYEFTVMYFTTNSAMKKYNIVTALDTWQMFRYKHPLFTQSMQYEAMITSAGYLHITDGVSLERNVRHRISTVLGDWYAARHNFTQSERYSMRIDDDQAEDVDVIDLAFGEILIKQFSDKSGYYLEANVGSDGNNWTSTTIFTTQPTRAQVFSALLTEGSGTDVDI
jgi:hypothetical protein